MVYREVKHQGVIIWMEQTRIATGVKNCLMDFNERLTNHISNSLTRDIWSAKKEVEELKLMFETIKKEADDGK